MGAELLVDDVTVLRGELPVVRNVSLICPPGQVTVLLGANGAGKSSLLDAIAGVIPIESGTVSIGSEQINRLRRDKRANRGLAYVEQGRTIFAQLTVDENLAVSADRGADVGQVFDLFPELQTRRNVQAQMLSGGEQQMLVLGRSLLKSPRVLMIDEMSQGLAPVIVKRLLPFVSAAAETGIAVLLVEQFAALALSVGTRASVMSVGQVVLEGDCPSLLERPDEIHRAYLQGESATPDAELAAS